MLHRAGRAARADELPPVGIELLFTVAEEHGLRGRQGASTPRRCARRSASSSTTPAPIGEVIVAAPDLPAAATPTSPGVEAHAGIRPEDGRSAIAAAAAAIARDGARAARRGDDRERRRDRTAAPSGERRPRALRDRRRGPQPRRRPGRRGRGGRWSTPAPGRASEHGCDVDVRIEELFRGYRSRRRSPSRWPLAEAALRACGFEPEPDRRPAAAATPTRFAAAGFDVRAPRQRHRGATTRRTSASAGRASRRCSTVCERRSSPRRPRAEAAPVSGRLEAAPRRRRQRGAADGRGRRRAPARPGPTTALLGRDARGRRGRRQHRGRRPRASAPAASTSSTST